MAARRCSTCSINWPLNVWRCPRCGSETWHSISNEPDRDANGAALEEEEYELGAVDVRVYDPEADAKIVDWRTLCFKSLGFGELHASALALRRDVDREQVERMVHAGASPEQVGLIVL